MSRGKFVLCTGIALVFFAYLASYLILSLQGRYEPADIGLNGVKKYAWAPRGFVSEFNWDATRMQVYFPLYYCDCRFWHTSDDAFDKGYPINKVEVKDIGLVYRAGQR